MKRFSLIFCLALAALGLSSCDTYVNGGYAYRPGYRPGVAYAPGYVRPGYGYRSPGYYNRPGYAWNSPPHHHYVPRQTYTPRGYPHSHLSNSSYRRDDGRWNNNSRYYRSSGARTNTRVNVGPVGVSNANWLRF